MGFRSERVEEDGDELAAAESDTVARVRRMTYATSHDGLGVVEVDPRRERPDLACGTNADAVALPERNVEGFEL